MEVLEAIYTRRSIRKYTAAAVDAETVRELLGAAMMAPSAGNQQPWQFVVVTDKAQLELVKGVHPHVGMAPTAPLGILVCGDESLEKFPGFWPQDCSAAMQNLLLAAHGLGLGAVWTGVYPYGDRIDRFREIFGLPVHVIPLAFAVIGHPHQKGGRQERYREDRVHWNRWGRKHSEGGKG
jgi:nitroreductase